MAASRKATSAVDAEADFRARQEALAARRLRVVRQRIAAIRAVFEARDALRGDWDASFMAAMRRESETMGPHRWMGGALDWLTDVEVGHLDRIVRAVTGRGVEDYPVDTSIGLPTPTTAAPT